MFRTLKPSQAAQDRQSLVPPDNAAPVSSPQPTPPQPVVYTPTAPAPQQGPPANGPQESYAPTAVSDHDRTAPDHPYAFITNPAAPAAQPFMNSLPGGNSRVMRVLLVSGGLLVLFIIFSVFKGLLISSPNLDSVVTVVQDQQELIHLASKASLQPGLPVGTQNLIATMNLSLPSSQSQTISYLVKNHKKIKPAQLNLKISTATDRQLTAAAAATTYNQTFQEIIQTKLAAYAKDLQQSYKLDTGKKGRALLKDSYRQAQLLQVQLATPAG